MKNYFSDDRDYRLMVRLHQARDLVMKARDRELYKYGISSPAAGVMVTIKFLNSINVAPTPGEISRCMLREPNSVSRIVARMENEGLLSKSKGPGKKNEIIVALTEKGEEIYGYAMEGESYKEIMSCLSDDEHRQLNSLLEKVRDNALQNINKRNKILFP